MGGVVKAPGSLLAHPLFVLASTVAEGGTISDLRAADFLFSCDASHPDTLRYLTARPPGITSRVLMSQELEVETAVAHQCR